MLLMLVFATQSEADTFAYIYEKYKRVMLSRAMSILRDNGLAEDAVSEAFIRVYKNMGKIEDPDSGRCAAFLLTIVQNTALTMHQRRTRQPVLHVQPEEEVQIPDSFDVEDFVLSRLSEVEILAVLDRISEDLRHVFVLKYAYGLSHRQIGKLLNLTENNVTVRLHRARNRLKKLLTEEGSAHA